MSSKILVSVILPTLGRPDGLQRCLTSLKALVRPAQEELEVLVLEDAPRRGVPERVHEGLQKAQGEYLVFASNDIEFHPKSLGLALDCAEREGKGLVAFNTGPLLPDRGNICEHFLISRRLVDRLGGEIFDRRFHHVGVDNLLWAKAEKLGEATRCEGALVTHHHFSQGAAFDEVYRLGWEPEALERDRALLRAELGRIRGPGFSVVVIARNEAETLPRLVQSLAEFQARGGEIVVCDTGSTDGTPDVARKLGCAVTEAGAVFQRRIDAQQAADVNTRFIVAGEAPVLQEGDVLFDFGAARNYAAGLASNDMVAMPDCDEVYTALALDVITERIRAGVEQFEYPFVFAHDEFGEAAVAFMHSKFYDRRKVRWRGIIHEVLHGQAQRERLPDTVIQLEHFQNHATDRSGYIRGLALDRYQNPEDDRNSHYFGRELMYHGRHRSAIAELRRHVAMKRWPAERAQSLVYIGDCHLALGEEEAALAAWHEAIGVESGMRVPWLRLANLYFRKNDHQRTASYASAALQVKGIEFYSRDERDYTDVPHQLLYWALWYLGDKAAAREHYEKARAYRPFDPRYLHDAQFFGASSEASDTPEEVRKRFAELRASVAAIQGWVSDEAGAGLYRLARYEAPTPVVVELGSWRGRSTCWLAAAIQDRGEGRVYAVDTWRGTGNENIHAEMLKGYAEDALYEEFRRNMWERGFLDTVVPMRMETQVAAEAWAPERKIGLLFIDADHGYEFVKKDFELWSPHVEVGGFIVFDDVPSWPGPTRLVSELPGNYRHVRSGHNQYTVIKER